MHFNYLAIGAATAINMFIGSLWYSPLMFSKIWAAGTKFHGEPKMTHFHLLRALGVALVTTIGLACIISTRDITEPLEAVKLVSLLWFTFVATSHYNAVIWAQKPISVYLIDVAYFLVTMSVSGALLAWWR